MRDSKSVDFDRDRPADANGGAEDDVIHAMAGSPTVRSGSSTPGMMTPKELVNSLPGDEEPNPFGEFNSVTRDVRGW